MTVAVKIAKGLAALGLLAVLLVAVPSALCHYVGWPLPRSLPSWSRLAAGLDSHGISDRVLLDALACAVWVTWALLATSVIIEIPAALRGRRPRRVALAGPLQPLVGRLVAAVLVAALAVPPRSVAEKGHAPLTSSLAIGRSYLPGGIVALLGETARPHASPLANGHAPSRQASAPSAYVVERGDTLWGIAERRLGDPLRWREIFALNRGRPEPDGAVLADPNWIYPGWTLVLPADASGHGANGEKPPTPPVDRRPRPRAPRHPAVPRTEPVTRRPAPATTLPESTSPTRPVAQRRGHAGGAHLAEPGNHARSPERLPVAPIGLGLLGVGLLALLAQLRRVQERHRRPGRRIALPTGELADLEAALYAGSVPLATRTVDRAVRLLGRATAGAMEAPSVIGAVLGRHRFDFFLEAPMPAPAPFTSSRPDRWSLDRHDRSVRQALLAAGDEASVLPTLVTIGEDDDGIVFLNLEAGGQIAISGNDSVATEIATAIALELSVASWVECCELYDVGVGTGQANPNRCTTLASLTEALPVIAGLQESMSRELAGSGLASAAGARLKSPSEQWPCLVVVSNTSPTADEQFAIDRLEQLESHGGSLLESIALIVPHQANKTMVSQLATQAGLPSDSLYFNIEQVGNSSSASIPLAIHDAVRDGVIKEPARIFTPGFGAGAVAGYSVMRIDPAVVAIATDSQAEEGTRFLEDDQRRPESSSDDVRLAFG